MTIAYILSMYKTDHTFFEISVVQFLSVILRPHLICGFLFLCSDESSERDKSSDDDDDVSDGDDDDQDDVNGDDDVDDNDDDGNGVCDNDNDDSCGDMNDDDKELQEAEHRNSIQNEK